MGKPKALKTSATDLASKADFSKACATCGNKPAPINILATAKLRLSASRRVCMFFLL
jgi:hypothetical protein